MEMPKNFTDLSGMGLDVMAKIAREEKSELDETRYELLSNQLDQCDSKFKQLLSHRNRSLVDLIKEHIKKFLEPSPFSHSKFKHLYAIAIILGMHVSDHSDTLGTIESRINEEFSKVGICVMRLTRQMMKQKKVINNLILAQVTKEKKIVLIVEQTQMINRLCLDYLLGQLATINSEIGSMINIILIFCLSSNKPPINHLLTPDRLKIIRPSPIPIITWDQNQAMNDVEQLLLNDKDISFKLGPKMISLLDNQFTYRDATVANTKFLYTYGLVEHYDQEGSYIMELTKSQKKFKKYFTTAIKFVQELESINGDSDFENLDWSDEKGVRKLINLKVHHLLLYHSYIMSQINYFYILLRDETGYNFPSRLNELYQEVMCYDNLGKSKRIYDSINEFHRLGPDRALTRMERCVNNSTTLSSDSHEYDMLVFIQEYADKLRSMKEKSLTVSSIKTKGESMNRVPNLTAAVEGDVVVRYMDGDPFNVDVKKPVYLRSRAAEQKQYIEKKIRTLKSNDFEEMNSIVLQFTEKLHHHAERIISPLTKPLNEFLYYDQSAVVKDRCLPSVRYTSRIDLMDPRKGILKCKCCQVAEVKKLDPDNSSSFEDAINIDMIRLYSIIYGENEDMSISDLYDAYQDQVEATRRILKDVYPQERKKRASKAVANIKEVAPEKVTNTGLLKARFINAVHDLESHGLVKRCTSTSKRNTLQKVIWL